MEGLTVLGFDVGEGPTVCDGVVEDELAYLLGLFLVHLWHVTVGNGCTVYFNMRVSKGM